MIKINIEKQKLINATYTLSIGYKFLDIDDLIKKFLFPDKDVKQLVVPSLNNPYIIVPIKIYIGKYIKFPLSNILVNTNDITTESINGLIICQN